MSLPTLLIGFIAGALVMSDLPLARAVYHGVATAYYAWAVASIHPAHADVAYVIGRHDFHAKRLAALFGR